MEQSQQELCLNTAMFGEGKINACSEIYMQCRTIQLPLSPEQVDFIKRL